MRFKISKRYGCGSVPAWFRPGSGLSHVTAAKKNAIGKLQSAFCVAGVVFGASGTVLGLLCGMVALREVMLEK